MRRWFITRTKRRAADFDEREDMGLPGYASKRSPEVFIEWTEYLDVKTGRGRWHLEHLFATSFASKEKAKVALDRLCSKIEHEVVTLMMIGKHDVADEIRLIDDASPKRVPRLSLKDRRKVVNRVTRNLHHWPFNKEKRREKDRIERSQESLDGSDSARSGAFGS